MHPGALRALEFDRVVAAVRSFALTPTGAARLGALHPEVDLARVREALAATTEAVRYLADNPVFPLRAPDDLPELLELLDVEGRALEPLRLLGAGGLPRVGRDRAASAVRRASGELPRLRRAIATAASFRDEIADVRRQSNRRVTWSTTPARALASIRDRLRRQRAKLRETLDGYLRGKDTARYLQDQIVTERNGRFVLLVKAEHRASLPGLVHGSSSSGATLYLEPLATVEINNEVVELESEEAEEVLRILLALTDASAVAPTTCRARSSVATALDVLQAKARLAQITGAVSPKLSQDGRLELLAARHPLLMQGRRLALLRRLDGPAGGADTRGHQTGAPEHGAAHHRVPTPAARPWRSRRRACWR